MMSYDIWILKQLYRSTILRHNLIKEHAGLLDEVALARCDGGEVNLDEVAHLVLTWQNVLENERNSLSSLRLT